MNLYKQDQIDMISKKVGLPKTLIEDVLNCYSKLLDNRIKENQVVKLLRIGVISQDGKVLNELPTFAYDCHEVANELGIDKDIALNILLAYEEVIIVSLRSHNSINIYNFVTLYTEIYNGQVKLRSRKSTRLKYTGYRVHIRRSFKYSLGSDL